MLPFGYRTTHTAIFQRPYRRLAVHGSVPTACGTAAGMLNDNPDADLNKDGGVDFSDVAILSYRYGSDCTYGGI